MNFRKEPKFQGKVMTFHRTEGSTRLCCCKVVNGIGFDAFDQPWKIVTDDFGNIVFVK